MGPIVYGTGHEEVFLGRDFGSTRDFSEKVAADIDAEVRSIVDKAYKRAEEILTENRAKLDFTAEYLVDHEIMDEEQFKYIMDTDEPTVEAVEAIALSKSQKSDAENEQQKEINEQREKEEAEKQENEAQKFTVKKKDETEAASPENENKE